MERSCFICVRLARCWNGNWRCLLVLGCLLLGGAMLIFVMKDNNSGPMLANNWQKHWSQTQDSAAGKQHLFETSGNIVNIKEQSVEQFVAQQHNPNPDDSEYYDRDSPDVIKKDFEYMQQYHVDQTVGKQRQAKPGSMGLVPDIHDYSLHENFRLFFKNLPTENIRFDGNYVNPCWAESIPKYPYKNNSYLKVREQVAVLDAPFKYMRQLFAKRTDLSNHWRLRCLPYFYVMETPPMATPRLFNALRFHPFVVNPEMTEPEFWNQKGPDGATVKDYLDLYDAASEKIRNATSSVIKGDRTVLQHKLVTGDGTGSYLWTLERWRSLPGNLGESEPKTTTAHLIKRITPTAKIVIVLRNPTERLFQGYTMRNENPSPSDFHTKAGQALQAMSDCVDRRSLRACVYDSSLNNRLQVRLRIGMYYPFVSDWIDVFGKDQVKVVRYEDYVTNPSEIINEVCAFLGLTPYPTKDLESIEVLIKELEKKRKANQKLKMMSTTRKMLKEFHSSLNQELSKLLADDRFTWPELINEPDEAGDQKQDRERQERDPQEQQRTRERQEAERRFREGQQQQQQREQQQREQQQREQQQKEQQRRDQQQKEQQRREQQQRDLARAQEIQQQRQRLQFQQNQQQAQRFQQQGQQIQQPGQQVQQGQQRMQEQQNQQQGQQFQQQRQQLGQQNQQQPVQQRINQRAQ